MAGISFIITTSGEDDTNCSIVVNSIIAENIPEYEIIIMGGESTTITGPNIKHIPFNEHQFDDITIWGFKGRWISRKINLAVKASKYDIVVISRDYIKLLPGWYQGFNEYGTDWDICLHQDLLFTGVRGINWRIDKYPGLPRWCMIPYDLDNFTQYMIMPGGHWVAKKEVMLKYPINENLLWGMQEDTEWTRRVITTCKIKCNPACRVQYIKPKHDDPNHLVDVQTMESLNDFWNALRHWKTENLELSEHTLSLIPIVSEKIAKLEKDNNS
jgi:hypothetical protein